MSMTIKKMWILYLAKYPALNRFKSKESVIVLTWFKSNFMLIQTSSKFELDQTVSIHTRPWICMWGHIWLTRISATRFMDPWLVSRLQLDAQVAHKINNGHHLMRPHGAHPISVFKVQSRRLFKSVNFFLLQLSLKEAVEGSRGKSRGEERKEEGRLDSNTIFDPSL